jgi:isopentenyl diphosphate isomerase/L-lactate dehydrogenase-like FMN-dependent dehydrogenase
MSERQVLIRTVGLQFPFNSVVPQSALRMDDRQLDQFIAAGHAIEFAVLPETITPEDMSKTADDFIERVAEHVSTPVILPEDLVGVDKTADQPDQAELLDELVMRAAPKPQRRSRGG